MDTQTPKRFKLPARYIGIAEIIGAVLLTLTGYSIGQGESLAAIVIGAAYAGIKNFVERCQPVD